MEILKLNNKLTKFKNLVDGFIEDWTQLKCSEETT